MRFWNEFKSFAVKGNMMDLAIAVIIGTAFNAIINSLVKNVISPPLGVVTSGVDVSQLKFKLRPAVEATIHHPAREAVYLEYGAFLESMIDFGIIALTLFVVVKFMSRLKARANDPKDKTVPTPKDIELLSDILDEMKKFNAASAALKSTKSEKG